MIFKPKINEFKKIKIKPQKSLIFSFIFFLSKHNQTKKNLLENEPNLQSMELKYSTLSVLNETMTTLGAWVRWCSCNIFSKQDHATTVVSLVITRPRSLPEMVRPSKNTSGVPSMLSTRVTMVGPISLLMMVGKLISSSMKMLRLRRSKRRVV